MAAGLVLIALLNTSPFTVEYGSMALVQRLGKFTREAGPGLRAKIPFIGRVAGRMNPRDQQMAEPTGTAMIEAGQAVRASNSGGEAKARPTAPDLASHVLRSDVMPNTAGVYCRTDRSSESPDQKDLAPALIAGARLRPQR